MRVLVDARDFGRTNLPPLCGAARSLYRPLLMLLFHGALLGSVAKSQEPRPKAVSVELNVVSVTQLIRHQDFLDELPNPAHFGLERIIAFEEYWSFIYLCGIAEQQPVATPDSPPRFVRRVFVIKPSYAVIDDQLWTGDATDAQWVLHSPASWQVSAPLFEATVPSGHLQGTTLLPASTQPRLTKSVSTNGEPVYSLTIDASGERKPTQWLHVIALSPHSNLTLPECDWQKTDDGLRLSLAAWDRLTSVHRITELDLPQGMSAGKVKIFDRGGYVELPRRIRPSGILSLGEEALKLRLGWDLAYRTEGWNTWDAGQASSHLRQLVENGTIQRGRAVDLGCGSGHDALYLASQGFDVTGIDVSPTALNLGARRAQRAKQRVTWLLADVLAPPPLEPFDFVFDRGCYHEVRRLDASGYVDAVWRLTRPGSRILLLAGNANDSRPADFRSPPRVSEAEIRRDFARGFRVLSLSEFYFDPNPVVPGRVLGWSVLLERLEDR